MQTVEFVLKQPLVGEGVTAVKMAEQRILQHVVEAMKSVIVSGKYIGDLWGIRYDGGLYAIDVVRVTVAKMMNEMMEQIIRMTVDLEKMIGEKDERMEKFEVSQNINIFDISKEESEEKTGRQEDGAERDFRDVLEL